MFNNPNYRVQIGFKKIFQTFKAILKCFNVNRLVTAVITFGLFFFQSKPGTNVDYFALPLPGAPPPPPPPHPPPPPL